MGISFLSNSGGSGSGSGTIDTNLSSSTNNALAIWDGTSATFISQEASITTTGTELNSVIPINVGVNLNTEIDDGFITFNELGTAPTGVANKGSIYVKDVSNVSELFYIDSSGQEVQITNNGNVNAGSGPGGGIDTNLSSTTNNALVLWDGTGADTVKQLSSVTSDGTSLNSTIDIEVGTGSNDQTVVGTGFLSLFELDNTLLTIEANKGSIFTQKVSGVTELFYEDSNGQSVQITENGNIFNLGEGFVNTNLTSSTDRALVLWDGTDGYLVTEEASITSDGTALTSTIPIEVGANQGTILNDGTVTLLESASDPSNVGNSGIVYTKEVSGTTELFYLDDSGNAVQITDAGILNGVGVQTLLSSSTNNALALWDGTNAENITQSADITVSGGVLDSNIPITVGSSGLTNVNDGFIRFTESASNPSAQANTGAIFTKDVLGGTELFYLDADNQEVQITDNGLINVTGVQTLLGSSTDNAMVLWDGTSADSIKQETAVTSDGVNLSSTIPVIVGSGSGTTVDDGFITFVELSTNPTSALNAGSIFAKDVSGDTELFYLDSSNQEVQLTSNGLVNASGIQTSLSSSTNNALLLWDGTDATLAKQEPSVTSDGYELKSTIDIVVGTNEGTIISDGVLTLAEQSVNPGLLANSGSLFTKEVSNITELFYLDSDGTEIQLTNDGLVNASGVSTLLNSSNDQALALWDGTDATRITQSTGITSDGYFVRFDESNDPSAFADSGAIYTKDVSGTTELFYIDDSGNVVQITNSGVVNNSSLGAGTDNRIARFDGTSALQESLVSINDSGTIQDANSLFFAESAVAEIAQSLLASGNASPLEITAQSSGAGDGGDLNLRPGGGTVNNGAVNLKDGQGTDRVSVTTSGDVNLNGSNNVTLTSGQEVILSSNGLQFSEGTTSPVFSQEDNTTNSATGETLTIHPQDATGSGSTGGSLVLRPGSGNSTDGEIDIRDADGNSRITINASQNIVLDGYTDFNFDGNLIASIDSESLNVEEALRLKSGATPNSVLTYGGLYSQNFGGSVELFYINDQGDITRLTNSGGGSANVDNLLPVLDVTKDLTAVGLPNNAIAGTPGGGDFIQDAIDHYISNPNDYHAIYLPPGTYRLTKPLVVRNGTGTARVDMIGGSGTSIPFTSGVADGAILQLDGGLNADTNTYNAANHAVMYIQGGLGCKFKGIRFHNTYNTLPNSATAANILTRNSTSDWTTSSTRTNIYSPCGALSIDPFINGNPGGNAANQHPQFGTEYSTNVTQSEFLTFENCSFSGGYVGTAIALADANVVTNNITFNNCHWNSNTISISSRGKGIELNSPYFEKSYTNLDNIFVGPPSGVQKSQPVLTGLPKVRLCRNLLSLNGDDVLHISNLDLETTPSLGEFGVIDSNDNNSVKFTGCKFTFLTATNQSIDDGEADFILLTRCPVEFDNCTIKNDSEAGLLRFIQPSTFGGFMTFRNTTFLNADSNDAMGLGFARPESVEFINCKSESTNENGQITINNFLSRYEYFETDQNVTLTKVGSATTGNQATATYTNNIENLEVGDVAVVWDTSTAVSIPRVDTAATNIVPTFTPIGVVTNINSSTGVVTISYLSRAVSFTAPYRIYYARTLVSDGESSTLQKPNYLTGSVTFDGYGASALIPFRTTPRGGKRLSIGSDYNVILSPTANEVFWTSDKTDGYFVLNSSNSESVANLGWKVDPYPIYSSTTESVITSLDDISGLTALVDPRKKSNGAWPNLLDTTGNTFNANTNIATVGIVNLPSISNETIDFNGNTVFSWDQTSFELADLGSTFTIFIRLDPVTTDRSFLAALNNNNPQTRFDVDQAIFGDSTASPAPTLSWSPLSNDHTLIGVRTNTEMRIYQNGIEVASVDGLSSYTTATGDAIFGGRTNGIGQGEIFEGSVKIFGIYNTAISARQAFQLHNHIITL